MDNKNYRKVFGHFYFKHEKWKVEADTEFAKLKIAYKSMLKGKEPFIISRTARAGNECLTVNGETSKAKKLYI